MADPVVLPDRPVLPVRPGAKVPQLPGLFRKVLAGQWPETEATLNTIVVWAPAEAEWQARRALALAKAKADELFEAAPGQIGEGRVWLDAKLGAAWVAAKAWVREYLGLKPEKK